MQLTRGRRILVAAVAAALLGGAAVLLAQAGFARSGAAGNVPPRVDPAFFFGPKMARAEVIMVIDAQTHDFRIDRGRVRANRGGSLTIRERDGAIVTIAVSPSARIVVDGRAAPLSAIKLRYNVQTVRDGDTPATWVRATSPR